MQSFENFISYRRKDSSLEVRNIYDALIKKGYSTFCDVYSLKSGNYDENLKMIIDTCINFILVISQATINSCTEENDWMYKEIKEAIMMKKNIVCVFVGDVVFPDILPREIDSIRYQNGLKFDIVYFDSFINKLVSQFLVTEGDLDNECSDSDFLVDGTKLVKYLGRGKNVKIPEGIEVIGSFSFKDKTVMEKLSFPASLVEIEESAFERCLNLSCLIFPEKLKRVGKKAFNRCFNVSYIQFNDALSTIEQEAFGYCNKLKTIQLNPGLESIHPSALNNCCQLASIFISSENNKYCADDGILYSKDMSTLIRCPEAYKTDIISLPQSVKVIESWAFYKCSRLIDVLLPRGLEVVKANAFKDCYGIEKLSVFENIKEFDVTALDGWTEEQQVQFSNKCSPLIKYNVAKKLKDNQAYASSEIQYRFILVKTTFESQNEAEDMVKMLLERKLIVSGQISKLHSIYMWNDEINSEDEVELSCITSSAIYPEVEEFIKRNHSYELCEIICIPIVKTTPEFEDWISSYVKSINKNKDEQK